MMNLIALSALMCLSPAHASGLSPRDQSVRKLYDSWVQIQREKAKQIESDGLALGGAQVEALLEEMRRLESLFPQGETLDSFRKANTDALSLGKVPNLEQARTRESQLAGVLASLEERSSDALLALSSELSPGKCSSVEMKAAVNNARELYQQHQNILRSESLARKELGLLNLRNSLLTRAKIFLRQIKSEDQTVEAELSKVRKELESQQEITSRLNRESLRTEGKVTVQFRGLSTVSCTSAAAAHTATGVHSRAWKEPEAEIRGVPEAPAEAAH
jgi:hypothetical protein